MLNIATTTYTFSDPVVTSKSGEVTKLVPINATNQNFQFQKVQAVTEYNTDTTTNGFTYGDVVISTLFITFILLYVTFEVYNFIIGVKRRTPTT